MFFCMMKRLLTTSLCHDLFYSEVSSACTACASVDRHTHHDQGHFALLAGSIGSQDGDHHRNGAHNVQDEEAGVPTLQLEEEEAIDRLIWRGAV